MPPAQEVSLEEMQLLRSETEKVGQRAGLNCPACVKRAFDYPDEYELDIPLAELLAEAARETPQVANRFHTRPTLRPVQYQIGLN